MSKTLTFTVKDGQVTCEATGFTGTACEAASQQFQSALGGAVIKRQRKPEYFQSAAAGSSINAGGKKS